MAKSPEWMQLTNIRVNPKTRRYEVDVKVNKRHWAFWAFAWDWVKGSAHRSGIRWWQWPSILYGFVVFMIYAMFGLKGAVGGDGSVRINVTSF